MKILVHHKASTKVIDVYDPALLASHLESLFNLAHGCYIVKKFNKEFEEYVDLEDFKSLEEKDKLKIEEMPVSLLDQPSCITEPPQEHASAVLQDVDVEFDLCLRNKRFPSQVILPLSDFSKSLRGCLESKQELNWEHSRELIAHLASYMYSFKSYPKKQERLKVCFALVEAFPYLKNDIGLGVEAWELRLLNKLKKIRQGDNSVEVQTMRTMTKSNKKTPKMKCLTSKDKELNWAPDPFPGEDNYSAEIHKKVMKEEFAKSEKNRDVKKISNLMALTYSFRRVDINQKMRVNLLKDEYPFLFDSQEQFMEMERLTSINVRQVFFTSVADIGRKLFSAFKCNKKKEKQGVIANCQFSFEDLLLEEKKLAEASIGLLVLPALLKEEAEYFVKQVHTDDEVTSIFPRVFCHDMLEGPYILVIEDVQVSRADNFLEAIALLMSFYFTLNISYPKEILNTLSFIQQYVLKMSIQSAVPPRVKTLYKKLQLLH